MDKKLSSYYTTLTCFVVGIVFTILKLCSVIAWSWVWVLVPIWGYFTLCFLVEIGVKIVEEGVRRYFDNK